MHTLLLRLAGPMQSWGIDGAFNLRVTEMEPSKSGVVGLCCAALGPRTHDISDIAALRMGVRIDSPGLIKYDFQTAAHVVRASGKPNEFGVISSRIYLADSNFLVGLSGPDYSFLLKIHEALRNPVWQLYLGRKSYVPSIPVYIPNGLFKNTDLKDALINYPIRINPKKMSSFEPSVPSAPDTSLTSEEIKPVPLTIPLLLEMPLGQGQFLRNDQPVGAAFANRTFQIREIRTEYAVIPHCISNSDDFF